MTSSATACPSPIDAVIDRAAAGLLLAGDDRAAVVRVLETFLDEAMALINSPSAMWGFLREGMRRAGLDTSQQDRRFRIFSTVCRDRFMDGKPYPPDWPWGEPEAG